MTKRTRYIGARGSKWKTDSLSPSPLVNFNCICLISMTFMIYPLCCTCYGKLDNRSFEKLYAFWFESFFCELGAHTKVQNLTTTSSGILVTVRFHKVCMVIYRFHKVCMVIFRFHKVIFLFCKVIFQIQCNENSGLPKFAPLSHTL